jgi:hypothetical protein
MGKYLRISSYIRKPCLIYDFPNCSTLKFLIYEENLIFFFFSAYSYYRYASKAYNSESDYGSEYGEDGQPHHPQQQQQQPRPQAPPSEAGTYHSKYSRQENNDTLSRSRTQGGSRYLE